MVDTGDGWNPTYAVARLMSTPKLSVDGTETLPPGQLLIIGGDLVYPTASHADYDVGLDAPFDEAAKLFRPDQSPHMYAVPGSHDWHDGLISFTSVLPSMSCRATYGAAPWSRDWLT